MPDQQIGTLSFTKLTITVYAFIIFADGKQQMKANSVYFDVVASIVLFINYSTIL